jgi:hypothetical protein
MPSNDAVLQPYTTGLFLIISLNPAATVAPIQDDYADHAARKLSTKKYVA